MKITSVNNDLVKETAKLLKSKYRDETGLFLIEGEKGVSEAIEAGIEIQRIFVLEGFYDNRTNCFGGKFAFARNDENIVETTEAVLSKISDAKNAPKVIAIAKQQQYDSEAFSKFKKVILLEGIKDAGNLGTVLRTASAFGIDGVVLYGDTVDLYNPKCVRSTVGCLWKTPTIHIKEFKILEEIFTPFERIATLPKSENVIPLNDYLPNNKTLVMFGSEADGLTEELKNFATKNITIEMRPNVESLNLSVSASIIMYKIRN